MQEQEEYCDLFADPLSEYRNIDYGKVEEAIMRYRAYPPPLHADASTGNVEPGTIIRGKVWRRLEEVRTAEHDARRQMWAFSAQARRKSNVLMPDAVVEAREHQNELDLLAAARSASDLEVIAEGVFGNEPALTEVMVEAGELVLSMAGLVGSSMGDILRSVRTHMKVDVMKTRPPTTSPEAWAENPSVVRAENVSKATIASLLQWTGQTLPPDVVEMFVSYLNPYQDERAPYGFVERFLIQAKLQSDSWVEETGCKIVDAAASSVMDLVERETALELRQDRSEAYRPIGEVLSGVLTTDSGCVTIAELLKGIKSLKSKSYMKKLKKNEVARLYFRLGAAPEGVEYAKLEEFLKVCVDAMKGRDELTTVDCWEASAAMVAEREAGVRARAAADATAEAAAEAAAKLEAEAAAATAQAALDAKTDAAKYTKSGSNRSGGSNGGKSGGRRLSTGVKSFGSGPVAPMPAGQHRLVPSRHVVTKGPR
jgi:hypothetical protein